MSNQELDKVFQSQRILDEKLGNILAEIKAVKDVVQIAIDNQQLIKQYENDITDRLKRIEVKTRNL